VPSGSFALIIWRQTNQVQARIVPDANGNFNGNADVPCGLGDRTSTVLCRHRRRPVDRGHSGDLL